MTTADLSRYQVHRRLGDYISMSLMRASHASRLQRVPRAVPQGALLTVGPGESTVASLLMIPATQWRRHTSIASACRRDTCAELIHRHHNAARSLQPVAAVCKRIRQRKSSHRHALNNPDGYFTAYPQDFQDTDEYQGKSPFRVQLSCSSRVPTCTDPATSKWLAASQHHHDEVHAPRHVHARNTHACNRPNAHPHGMPTRSHAW